MWKKILVVLLLSVALTACHFKLTSTNETGWTVLRGIYVKTETGDDVLTFETRDGETLYIFMTFAEGCDAPKSLQTGDKIDIKIVFLQGINGVNATQVFAWEKVEDSPVFVDSEVLSEIEKLPQQLRNADTTEK